MMDLLLKLLGVWADQAGKVADLGLSYQGGVPLWIVLLLGLGLGALVFYTYRRTAEFVSPKRRIMLASLRAAFLFLLLLILIKPVVVVTVAGSVRQTLMLLIDSSASMNIQDLRVDQSDKVRAAIALGNADVKAGTNQQIKTGDSHNPTRADVVKAALKNDKLDLLPTLDRQFDVAAYAFDRDVRDLAVPRPRDPPVTRHMGELIASVVVVIGLMAAVVGAGLAAFFRPRLVGYITAGAGVVAFIGAIAALMYIDRQREFVNRGSAQIVSKDWVEKINATGPQTAIGDGLRDAILRKRGQPVAGVVLITDGANNAGSLPLEAAKMAQAENLPLYVYGVGITSPRDIIVSNIFAQDVAFVRDELPVTVRVRSQGLKGQTARITLKLGEDKVDEKEVAFDEDGEQVISLKVTPEKIGEFDLVANIEPRGDEVVKDNNTTLKRVRVIDGRIKVLLIDQMPRWDFKYVQTLLLRDRRVDAKFLLFDADTEVTQIPNSPYLKTFPIKKEELLAYDLIIWGDVDPKRFSPQQLEWVNEFVAKFGGGFIMIAGKRHAPHSYRKTPIENLLPVEFDQPVSSLANIADKPVRFELTPTGKSATMLKLSDKEQENLQKWAQLPPIYWAARVSRPKPAAEVLLVDTDAGRASRISKMPIIAQQQYGLGNVLYIGTDNTWRWRRNRGVDDHARLWSQMIERMALPHLLGGSKRTQLNFDRDNYMAGERVTVFARLYSEKSFEPVTDPSVGATFAPLDGASTVTPRRISLRPAPDQPGIYRGEFVAPPAGNYRFKVDTDPATPLDFTVSEATIELSETALNVALLKDMATATGGAFLREEDLHKLGDTVRKNSPQKLSTFEVEFWQSPLYFLLLMTLLTAEWILRKVSQLK